MACIWEIFWLGSVTHVTRNIMRKTWSFPVQRPHAHSLSHWSTGRMGCCLKCTLTSGPPTLFALSSSWFAPLSPDSVTKKKKQKTEQMSQEFIPIARECSDLVGATGLRPLKENMGHSHAPSSLLLQGGDEVEVARTLLAHQHWGHCGQEQMLPQRLLRLRSVCPSFPSPPPPCDLG